MTHLFLREIVFSKTALSFQFVAYFMATLLSLQIMSLENALAEDHLHTGHMFEVDLNSVELRERLIQKGVYRFDHSGRAVLLQFDKGDAKDDSIQQGLQFGERLLKWVDLINATREDQQKIRLTSPGSRRSYPITAPNRYSPRTVASALAELRQVMPMAMQEVLFGSGPLTSTNPVSDEDFIKYGRDMDRIYQTSARWTMLVDWKQSYIANRVKDVRGYYFLSTNNWNAQTLTVWETLSAETQGQIKEAFLGICINNRQGVQSCQRTVTDVNTAAKAVATYNRYITKAREVFNNFFQIRGNRGDIEWSSKSSEVASMPFVDPAREDVRRFVQDNIEDEFSWKGWGLKIQFTPKRPAPYIVFIPGVTANVEFLGGNKIEMDANKSLQEYEEQWTIRHEFGLVLGFPDCYQEFYDEQNEEFINYQLDVTDLMCSRAGNFNQRMYDQMADAYLRK
jgi:hypothetical protein